MARLVTNKSVLDLFSKVVMDTPVDKGHLRGNWQVSIGSPDNSEIEGVDKGGQETISRANRVLFDDQTSHPVYIQNNVPYAEKIEYGGSPVKAPRGMLRRNLTLMNTYIRNAISELKGGK